MKNFLNLSDAGGDAIAAMIADAIDRKAARAGKPKGWVDADAPLAGHTLAMIFEKNSTRTRVSFDMAIRQLGGTSLILDGATSQLGRGESIADTARVLSRMVDAIMIRTDDPGKLTEMAECASVPVINGLSDDLHPCQLLADMQTYNEHRGSVSGKRVAWIGDGNNVCNSLIFGCSKTQTKISIATPKGFEPDPEVVKKASKNTTVDLTTDPKSAVKDANVVMTDTFMSIHTSDSKQAEKFLPSFQVNQSLMVKAKKDAIFMHCLPAKRDQEVTSEVIDGAQSAVWTQAENRLHTQKALLISLLGI